MELRHLNHLLTKKTITFTSTKCRKMKPWSNLLIAKQNNLPARLSVVVLLQWMGVPAIAMPNVALNSRPSVWWGNCGGVCGQYYRGTGRKKCVWCVTEYYLVQKIICKKSLQQGDISLSAPDGPHVGPMKLVIRLRVAGERMQCTPEWLFQGCIHYVMYRKRPWISAYIPYLSVDYQSPAWIDFNCCLIKPCWT